MATDLARCPYAHEGCAYTYRAHDARAKHNVGSHISRRHRPSTKIPYSGRMRTLTRDAASGEFACPCGAFRHGDAGAVRAHAHKAHQHAAEDDGAKAASASAPASASPPAESISEFTPTPPRRGSARAVRGTPVASASVAGRAAGSSRGASVSRSGATPPSLPRKSGRGARVSAHVEGVPLKLVSLTPPGRSNGVAKTRVGRTNASSTTSANSVELESPDQESAIHAKSAGLGEGNGTRPGRTNPAAIDVERTELELPDHGSATHTKEAALSNGSGVAKTRPERMNPTAASSAVEVKRPKRKSPEAVPAVPLKDGGDVMANPPLERTAVAFSLTAARTSELVSYQDPAVRAKKARSGNGDAAAKTRPGLTLPTARMTPATSARRAKRKSPNAPGPDAPAPVTAGSGATFANTFGGPSPFARREIALERAGQPVPTPPSSGESTRAGSAPRSYAASFVSLDIDLEDRIPLLPIAQLRDTTSSFLPPPAPPDVFDPIVSAPKRKRPCSDPDGTASEADDAAEPAPLQSIAWTQRSWQGSPFTLAPWIDYVRAARSSKTTSIKICPRCRVALTPDEKLQCLSCAGCNNPASSARLPDASARTLARPLGVHEFQLRSEFVEALSSAVCRYAALGEPLDLHGAFAEAAPEGEPATDSLRRLVRDAGVRIGQHHSTGQNPGHRVDRYLCACGTRRQRPDWLAACGGVVVLSCRRIPPSHARCVPGQGFEIRIAH